MNRAIVYHYPCRWGDTPSRQRYLMEAMSAHTPVVFLNSTQLEGELLEAKRPWAESISESLTVVHNAFGFRTARLGKRLGRIAAAIDADWLHTLLRKQGIQDYIYWLSTPSPEMLWGMQTKRLIYDCIDPCFIAEKRIDHQTREAHVAGIAKIVFCTAETLLDQMKQLNPASYLLPNACPEKHCLHASRETSLLPALLRDRLRPIIGYMGTFDFRVDVETLYQAAYRLPEFTFALVGRVNADQEQAVRPLQNLPNVVMPGAVSVEHGQAYTEAFDVGLIPFKPGRENDAVNPVKMYMYLAAGKPVVTTDLKEPARHPELVQVTKGASDFTEAIVKAVTENSPAKIKSRIDFAHQNTWQIRAQVAANYLQREGLLETTAASRHVEVTACH